MDLLKLKAVLGLDSSQYEQGLDDAKGKASSIGSVIGNGLKTAAKIGAAAIGTATTAVGALGAMALSSYSNYEQLVGGVDKLYGTASNKVQEYANKAYMTAGMSANAYMETATSFSAALINSLGGDVDKAADITDVAMKAMSDNVNIFGSDFQSVQNAFQGFAKQNYTMLDNLKLGYGGTKTEMERLIEDANEYRASIGETADLSIDSFADVVQAIQSVQEAQHIAGTTNKEAMKTIEGTATATKAAWQNVVTAIGRGEGLSDALGELTTAIFGTDSETGLLNQVIPRIQTIMEGIGDFVGAAGPFIAEKIPVFVSDIVPSMLSAGVELLGALGQGILDNLPTIITASIEIINKLIEGFIEALPYLAEGAIQILVGLEKGIAENLPTLIPMVVDIILQINEALIDNIDLLVDGAIALITGLAIGLINALPVLIEKIPEIIVKMVEAFIENAPKLLEAGKTILESLVQGFQEAFPVASEAIGGFLDGVKAAFDAVVEWVAPLVDSLVQFFGALKDALFAVLETIAGYIKSFIEKHKNEIDMFITTIKTILTVAKEYIVGNLKTSLTLIRDIITTVLNVISNLIKAFVSVLKGDWSGALNYLKDATRAGLDGIKNLFSNLKDNLGDTFRNIVSAMKDWGHDMIESLVSGIQERISSVVSAVAGVADTIRGYLHFTEPDVGPLSDFHTYAPDMMKLFAKGIADNTDIITKQLDKSFDFADIITGTSGTTLGGSASSVNNVVINVYGAVGQSVEDLAEIVSEKIDNATGRRMIAMGVKA